MSREEVMESINEIFVNIFDDDNLVINDSTTAEDIEDWDSLSHLSIISEIEDEFEIKFTPAERSETKNVGELVDAVIKHLAE